MSWLLRLSMGLVASVIFLCNLFPHRLPDSLPERARVLGAAGKIDEGIEVCLEILKKDPEDFDTHRVLLKAGETKGLKLLEARHPHSDQTFYFQGYHNLVLAGLNGGGVSLEPFDAESKAACQKALDSFAKVRGNLPRLNSLRGKALVGLGREKEAVEHFQRDIEKGELVEYAVEDLTWVYGRKGDLAGLRRLVEDPKAAPYSERAQRILAERELRVGAMTRLEFQRLSRTPAGAMAGALIIAAMWMVLLRRVDVFKSKPWWAVLGMFSLGALSMVLVCNVGSTLCNDFDPRPINFADLRYVLFHVGLVEEVTKLLPVLLVAGLTRKLNEPLDFVLYGCLSALGFATLENFDFFNGPVLTSRMQLRASVSVIGHLLYTGSVCYVWARCRFYKRRNPLLPCAMTFLLAVVWHALFDCVGAAMQFLMGLGEALLLGRLLGNVLAFSPARPALERGRSELRNWELIVATTLLLLLPNYLWAHILATTHLANAQLWKNLIFCLLPLVYFDSVAEVVVVPGREVWFPASDPDAVVLRTRSDLHLRLFRGLVFLAGSATIVGAALPSFLHPIPATAFVLTLLVTLVVYFGGAYGLVPRLFDRPLKHRWYNREVSSVLPWKRAAPSNQVADSTHARLPALGFSEQPLPAPAEEKREASLMFRALLGAGLGLAAISLSLLYWLSDDSLNPLLLLFLAAILGALLFPLLDALLSPLTLLRPRLEGLWLDPTGQTLVLLFGRGVRRRRTAFLLRSTLAGDRCLQSESGLAGWLVCPARTEQHSFPEVDLERVLESHRARLRELEESGTAVRTLTPEEVPQAFDDYLDGVQQRFLAAPGCTAWGAVWRTLRGRRGQKSTPDRASLPY